MSGYDFDLTGKVALVTGGSRGLGRAMAEGLASCGASVAIASRNADACDTVAAEIATATGQTCVGFGAHVGNWTELDVLVERVYEHFGKVDVLINNAGISPLYHSLPEVSEALYDKTLDVNLKGPFRLATLMADRMAAGDGGSIINISSAASTRPRAHNLPYAMAKAGLNALTQGIAHSYGPKVRSNAIVAGTFLTDISKAWDAEAFAQRAQTFALRRGGEPDEIVGAALYLASDLSTYTTGSLLVVDGGQP